MKLSGSFILLYKIMNIFSKFLRPKKQDHLQETVVIHFQYGLNDLNPLFELENRLESLLEDAKVGFFDGNEIAVSLKDVYFFMCGPDAEKIFETILPTIESIPFMNNADVRLIYGLPKDGNKEKAIKISS